MESDNSGIPAKPFWTGRRLIVLPVGAEPASGGDRIPIWIRPEGAFGTGEHPTTRLCLKALERHLPKGASAIDIGTGTGILAIAAIKLGAGRVLAVDIDPEVVDSAITNAAANDVQDLIETRLGSIEVALEDASNHGPAAVVIVNILAGAIEGLFSEGLELLVRPGGLLVLSGILQTQTSAVRVCARNHGFDLLAQEQEGEWACILARRVSRVAA
jgi:ribosomal protein L11 methyltransferase